MRPSWRGVEIVVVVGFPERRPIDADGDAVVAEPVQEGVDHVLGFKEVVPLVEFQVGGDDG